MVIKIGVLELQGGYALHHNLLKKIGLSSIAVKSSNDLKKSDGLLYIATFNGLSIYDGQSVVSYNYKQGLPNSQINQLFLSGTAEELA